MDYAELKEWEMYFYYEPTVADRLEEQLATLMHLVSGFVHKEQMKISEFMICPEKRPKPKSKKSSKKSLIAQLKSVFGGKSNEQ